MKLSSFWRFMACCKVCLIRQIIRKTMGLLMKKFGCWSFWGHWYMREAVLLVVHYQSVM